MASFVEGALTAEHSHLICNKQACQPHHKPTNKLPQTFKPRSNSKFNRYDVNWDAAGFLDWGFGAGCAFALSTCDAYAAAVPGQQWFCRREDYAPTTNSVCTFDGLARAKCEDTQFADGCIMKVGARVCVFGEGAKGGCKGRSAIPLRHTAQTRAQHNTQTQQHLNTINATTSENTKPKTDGALRRAQLPLAAVRHRRRRPVRLEVRAALALRPRDVALQQLRVPVS